MATSIPQQITTDWEQQEDSKIDCLSLRACLAQRKADLQAKSELYTEQLLGLKSNTDVGSHIKFSL